jgi:hypothetical protein
MKALNLIFPFESLGQERATKRAVDGGDFAARYAVEHFSGFEFSLLPSRVHARPLSTTQTVGPLPEIIKAE